MEVGSRTEWDERVPQTEIDRRKDFCLRRLGIEIAPHLMHGPVRIRVVEKVEHTNDFGFPRTVYTLLATVDPA